MSTRLSLASMHRIRWVSTLLGCALALTPPTANAGTRAQDSPDPSQGVTYTTIPYDTFEAPGGYTLADYYTKWSNPYGPGEMGIVDTRAFPGGVFSIDAAPFQTGADFSVFDHIKYLALSNQAFVVPKVGSVMFSMEVNAETPGTIPGRVIEGTYVQSGDPYSAVALEGQQAGATLHMIDFGTGQLFDWFVSGSTAFTLIERLPSSVTGSPDPVGRDKMYTQIIDEVPLSPGPHTVAIRYTRMPNDDRVEYFLDGKRVSQVRTAGVPLDVQNVNYTGIYPSLGPGEPVRDKISAVVIGHGLFSLLDAFPFQHEEAPELSVSIPLPNRLFGQGARARYDNFTVTIGDIAPPPHAAAYMVPTSYDDLEGRRRGSRVASDAPAMLERPAASELLGAVTPNPTQGNALMEFVVPSTAHVRLEVFDMQGRAVSQLAEGVFQAGRHQAAWDGRTATGPATAGVYYVRLAIDGQQYVRRFALVP